MIKGHKTAKWCQFFAVSLYSLSSLLLVFSYPRYSFAQQADPSTNPSAASRRIGAIKAIGGTHITLAPDSGSEVDIAVQATTRILRIAPGEKDLKNAVPVQLQELQVGDRILVAGKPTDDGSTLTASSIVVMKRSDLQARQTQELQDWQKRGVDGIASNIDAVGENVTIAARGKSVAIHTSNKTVIRRYASDSVKFDDAQPSTLKEIHPGDQVRARGDRNADGGELNAEEIVSGSFRNAAGTVTSLDPSVSQVTVHDLLSKKTIIVEVTQDSQLRRLPVEIAQRIAMRLKNSAAGAIPGASNSGGTGATGAASSSGASPDFQQMLSRLPSVSISDIHKGDAVILLSTAGMNGVGTAITLLTGVEPILQSASSASSASILTPWSLSAPSGDTGGP